MKNHYKTVLIFSCLLLYLPVILLCQEKSIARMTPSVLTLTKKDTSGSLYIIISLKCGYLSSDRPKEFDGFTGGVVYNFSFEGSMGKGFYAGLNLDYSKSTDDNFQMPGVPVFSRDYTITSIIFFMKFRVKFTTLGLNFALGTGNTSLKSNSIYGKQTDNFLSLFANLGLDYYVTKKIFLSLDFAYNQMIKSDRTNKMFIIKFGPSLLLN
jgi:hypothetical protein